MLEDYALTEEKLNLAVQDLARSDGTRCARLLDAWTAHLADLRNESFPEHLRSAHRRLRTCLVEPNARLTDTQALEAIDVLLDLQARMEW